MTRHLKGLCLTCRRPLFRVADMQEHPALVLRLWGQAGGIWRVAVMASPGVSLK